MLLFDQNTSKMITGATFAIPLLGIEAVYRSAEQTIVQYSTDHLTGARHNKMIILDTSDEEHKHILDSFLHYHVDTLSNS